MTKRNTLSYTVQYSEHRAKFTSFAHAKEFAQNMARLGGHHASVHVKSGIVAQYDPSTGELTPEFASA